MNMFLANIANCHLFPFATPPLGVVGLDAPVEHQVGHPARRRRVHVAAEEYSDFATLVLLPRQVQFLLQELGAYPGLKHSVVDRGLSQIRLFCGYTNLYSEHCT